MELCAIEQDQLLYSAKFAKIVWGANSLIAQAMVTIKHTFHGVIIYDNCNHNHNLDDKNNY